ncbi:MAG: P1 family peptidase, partial [Acidobacteriota bacterium]|nr:P1 family peptidase [Acidobacteriota bacterium]
GRRRARELGVRIGRLRPGPWNAITDVPGVRVGHATLVAGAGSLVVGRGPIRTGVTAVWPHAGILEEYLPCGFDMPNANGEVTGLVQAARLGILGSPICLTNTSSVGMVYDALLPRLPADDLPQVEPVVAETWDAFLNDIEGRHVHRRHVDAALDGAAGGAVAEGCVGGGTGMICYGFKGGIGTASRRLPAPLDPYAVGVLVQANHGARELLRIDGVPVGEEIADLRPEPDEAAALSSIIMVVATDAPLVDYQLDRLARRAVHGLAKTGSISGNSSGDFTLAFSTANRISRRRFWTGGGYRLSGLDQFDMAPLFEAAAEATEEAIVNALFMATDMAGRDGHRVWALPLPRTLEILARHRRLFAPAAAAEHAHA